MFPEKPPLDELTVQHFGVKGMHWGVRKEEVTGDIQGKAKTFGRRVPHELETGAAIVALAALGLAFARSPRAQHILTVPTSAAFHYMGDKNNRKKVGKALQLAGVVYSKL